MRKLQTSNAVLPYQSVFACLDTPIGTLEVVVAEEKVQEIRFLDAPRSGHGSSQILDQALAELRAYFDGSLKRFTVPVALEETSFSGKALAAVAEIPFGQTRSYLEIALRIGAPKAVRAVGNANRLNRIPIIIPCHRVIGKSGALTGYAGGLPRKEWLIAHEAR